MGPLRGFLCAVPHRGQSHCSVSFQLEPTVRIRAGPTKALSTGTTPVYQLEERQMALIPRMWGIP